MALGTPASLGTAHETSSDGTLTLSVSPTDGAVIYVFLAASVPSSGTLATFDVSGLGGTWEELENVPYGGRRVMSVWRGTKGSAWGSGTLTFTVGFSGLQDFGAVAAEIPSGWDTADPDDAPVSGAASNSLTLGDVGTVDSGDGVLVFGCHEDGANNFACTGYSEVAGQGALSNIRQMRIWFDDSSPDETPNLTSNGGGNAVGGVALVVNAAEDGGGDVSASLTGSSATVSAGSLGLALSKALTGQGVTGSQGSVTPALSVALAGSAVTSASGTLSPAISVALTGAEITTAQGTISASVPGSASLTGQAATFAEGSLTPSISVGLTGQAITSAQGDVTATSGVVVELSGEAATFAQGSMTPALSVGLEGAAGSFAAGSVRVEGEEEPSAKHAGRPKRRRYLVEIDGRAFEVDSVADASALLERAKALAVQTAETHVKREIKRARRRGRAEVRLDVPEIETPAVVLKPLVFAANEAIRAIYAQIARDAEIRELMRIRLAEEDEEDAIISLLLH